MYIVLMMSMLNAHLERAYPAYIKAVTQTAVIWHDGTSMPLGKRTHSLDEPTLRDQLEQPRYPRGKSMSADTDLCRIRYEPFFRKIPALEVEQRLVELEWLPCIFGTGYTIPTLIKDVHLSEGKRMYCLDEPTLRDQLEQPRYPRGKRMSAHTDPGRIRHEPFFRKMYGSTAQEVEQRLVELEWLPRIFGTAYTMRITSINDVHKKVQLIIQELEDLVILHPEYKPYLSAPGGSYKWRVIAQTERLSPHSYGIAIDINPSLAPYWQWELKKMGLPIGEDAVLSYDNQVPWDIILIFEKYGFIWGGKWYHFDAMHFEYRPEFFCD